MENANNITAAPASQLPCRIHPQVILSILDYQTRHYDNPVSGAILGYVAEGSVVEVTDCFLVEQQFADESSQDGPQFNIDREQLDDMYTLKQRIAEKESVIGWFSTNSVLDNRAISFLNWFATKDGAFVSQQHISSPIYLLVDATLSKKATLPIRVLTVNTPSPASFYSIPFEVNRLADDPSALIMTTRARRTTQGAAQRSAQTHAEAIASVAAPLTVPSILDTLEGLLLKAKDNVASVVAGKASPNSEAARLLFKALGSNLIDATEFEGLVSSVVKDSETINELASVVKIQADLLAGIATLTASSSSTAKAN